MFHVYSYTNKINGKKYIGKSNNLKDRTDKHKRAKNGCKIFNRAMKKYGINNFNFEILETVDTDEKAKTQEIYWIAYFKTNVCRYGKDAGYNQTDGGDGMTGFAHSEATKQKLSIAFSGTNNPMFGKHHIAGENNPMFGKHHTDEAKEKISKANRGKKPPNTKITQELANILRKEYIPYKMTAEKLATKYNISTDIVYRVLRGETWK